MHRRVFIPFIPLAFGSFGVFLYLSPDLKFMSMSIKQKFLVVVLVLVAIVSACSITIQIQKDNTNSTQKNSQETHQSSDSARVNFHLNP